MISPAPTPEEAAAALAAVSLFEQDVVPHGSVPPPPSRWKRAALIEGVSSARELHRSPPR